LSRSRGADAKETRQIILRHIIPKIIQQQERIKVRGIPKSKRPPQMTPAPSVVGFDLISLFTGRIDMAVSFLIPRVYSLDARRPTFRHTRMEFYAGEDVRVKLILHDHQKN